MENVVLLCISMPIVVVFHSRKKGNDSQTLWEFEGKSL